MFRPAAVVLVFLLGCSGPRAPILTISGSSLGEEGEILASQIARFETANPGLTVRIQETPDDATQRHQLYVQWLNAHVGRPDILQIDVVWTAELAAAGWLLPLDRFAPATEDFFPATIDANRWRGNLYAIPWFADVGMLYRRTDLIPDPPATFEAMIATAREAQRTGAVQHGIVWQGARYEGLVTVFVEFLGAFGGEIMTREGRVALNSEAAVRALSAMRDQIRDGLAPREVVTYHEEECRFAFQNGHAAYMRNWPYAFAAMNDRGASIVAGRYDIAPMPATAQGRPTATLGGAQLAINRWSEHPDLAWRLIAFLTAPEQMRERAAIAGQYPPRRSLYEGDALRGVLPASPERIRRIIEAATPRPVSPVYARLSSELQVELHRALTGEASPRDALNAATARMQRIVEESAVRNE